MKPLISCVEDDETLQKNYADYLRSKGGFEVDVYSTKAEALDGLRRRSPQLVLLDLELNGDRSAGFDICAGLRRTNPDILIIFLTSYADEPDKTAGLALDADDYIGKDISLQLLHVRIKSLFRRVEAYRKSGLEQQSVAEAASDDLGMDTVMSIATWRNQRLHLSLTQYWMLAELHRHTGKVRSHQQLMDAAQIVVEKNTIAAHIKSIRGEFLKIDPSFECIVTEHSRGYRWMSPRPGP